MLLKIGGHFLVVTDFLIRWISRKFKTVRTSYWTIRKLKCKKHKTPPVERFSPGPTACRTPTHAFCSPQGWPFGRATTKVTSPARCFSGSPYPCHGTNLQNIKISNSYPNNTFPGRNILSNDLNTNLTGISTPWYSSWVKALIIVIICVLIMEFVLTFNKNRLVLTQISKEKTKNTNSCLFLWIHCVLGSVFYIFVQWYGEVFNYRQDLESGKILSCFSFANSSDKILKAGRFLVASLLPTFWHVALVSLARHHTTPSPLF